MNVEPIKYMVKTIQTGTTPTTKNDDYFDGDIQWFTPEIFYKVKNCMKQVERLVNFGCY